VEMHTSTTTLYFPFHVSRQSPERCRGNTGALILQYPATEDPQYSTCGMGAKLESQKHVGQAIVRLGNPGLGSFEHDRVANID
jgi:hypothetical protein